MKVASFSKVKPEITGKGSQNHAIVQPYNCICEHRKNAREKFVQLKRKIFQFPVFCFCYCSVSFPNNPPSPNYSGALQKGLGVAASSFKVTSIRARRTLRILSVSCLAVNMCRLGFGTFFGSLGDGSLSSSLHVYHYIYIKI